MAETSTKQAALTRDTAPGGFIERLEMQMVNAASQILAEAATAEYHSLRASYCQRIISAPQPTAAQAAPVVAMGQYVIATTVYNDTMKTATCTITDNDLLSQLYSLWNTLAGIDQGV